MTEGPLERPARGARPADLPRSCPEPGQGDAVTALARACGPAPWATDVDDRAGGRDPGHRLRRRRGRGREILPLVVDVGRRARLRSSAPGRPSRTSSSSSSGRRRPDDLDGRGFVRPREVADRDGRFAASSSARSCSSSGGRSACRSSRRVFAARRPRSPLLARFTPEILEGGRRRPAPDRPADADGRRRGRPARKNLSQFGSLRRDPPGDGLRRDREGARDRGADPDAAGRPRRGSSLAKLAAIGVTLAVSVGLAAAAAWFYTLVLFEPLPVAGFVAAGVLDWLAPDGVRRDHVPRQHADPLGARRRRDRVVALIVIGILADRSRRSRRGCRSGWAAPARALALGLPVAGRSGRRSSATLAADRRLPSRSPGCRSAARSSEAAASAASRPQTMPAPGAPRSRRAS